MWFRSVEVEAKKAATFAFCVALATADAVWEGRGIQRVMLPT